MPPINRPQSPLLPPTSRTSQPYGATHSYGAHHSQYAANTQANVTVSASSATFASQSNQEIQRKPTIPRSQLPPPVAKNLLSISSPSADIIQPEPSKASQSYQWTNSSATNISQSMVIPGISSSIDKTSQVYSDKIASSQTSYARVSKVPTNDQSQSVAPITSNVSLPPSNVTQHLNQNSHTQQDPTASVQSSKLRNIQTQSNVGSMESLTSSQLKYGSQQNMFGTVPSTPSSSAQNLFSNSGQTSQNMSPHGPQDCLQPLKPQQNLLTGYMDSTGLGNISQGQNIHQNVSGQRRYPQDTANTAMLPPRNTAPSLGSNQLHGARPQVPGIPPSGVPPSGISSGMPPSGMQPSGMQPSGIQLSGMQPSAVPPLGILSSGMPSSGIPASGMPLPSGHQMVMKSENVIFI